MSKLSQAWRGRSAFEQFFVDVYDSLPSFKRQSSNSKLVNKIKQKRNINIRKAGDELEDVLMLDQILTDENLLSTLNSREIEKLKKIIKESKEKILTRKSYKEFSERNNFERIERLRREIDKDFIETMEKRLEKLGAQKQKQKQKGSRLHMEKNELMEKMRLEHFGTTDLTQEFIDRLGERDRLMAEMMGAVELERLDEADNKRALKEREEYIYKLMKKLGINTVENRRRAREARESKSRGSRTSRKGFGRRKRKGSTKKKNMKKSMKKKRK